jgi:hypothetical protein
MSTATLTATCPVEGCDSHLDGRHTTHPHQMCAYLEATPLGVVAVFARVWDSGATGLHVYVSPGLITVDYAAALKAAEAEASAFFTCARAALAAA